MSWVWLAASEGASGEIDRAPQREPEWLFAASRVDKEIAACSRIVRREHRVSDHITLCEPCAVSEFPPLRTVAHGFPFRYDKDS